MYTKTLKIRLLPTKEQEELMWKHVNGARFIWNYMLALQEERYKNDEKYLSHFDMCSLLTSLRKEEQYEWLNEVSIATLQKVCRDLDKAYQKFFKKKSNRPKFKSCKSTKNSFPISCDIAKMYFENEKVQILKIGKVKYQTNYDLPQGKNIKFGNARVIFEHNKWILYFIITCESQNCTLSGKMGIDVGLKDLAVVSFNDTQIVFPNINKSSKVKKLEGKLHYLQRSQHRKYCTNGNYEKSNAIKDVEIQIREIYYRLVNIRKDYIHQCSNKIVSLLPEKITMETLSIIGMRKNKNLSKSINDQCLSEFIRQIKYKCEQRGIQFIQADPFFPSSKKCSYCGNIKHDLKLSDRIYHCDVCGATIDRDYNAAINLMNYST